MPSPESSLVGQTILHYRILRKLGEGGMGAVYQAEDLKVDRLVALKFTSEHLLESPTARERFVNEARATSRLNHPNIETLYGVEEFEGRPFLVLEYLPGGTLTQVIKNQTSDGREFPVERAVAIGLGIADGLVQAHRNGIVHRDIKPANILFSAEGLPKITDFGLSKLRGTRDLTKTGHVAGTVGYMSPEQAQGLEVDPRSDIFSLGAVLYETLAGQKPFQADSAPAILYKIVHEPAPNLQSVRPGIPEALSALVGKCLAKSPDHRPPRAVDVADALRSISRDYESKAVSAAVTELLGAPRRPAHKPIARRMWLWLIFAAAVLVAVLMSPLIVEHARDWLRTNSMPKEKKLAVLAFANVGNDPANQAFCDGLMETLTSMLTQLESLHGSLWVVPAGELRPIKTAAEAHRAFGANLVISGSVQRSQNNVRVTINLVDAALGRNLASRVIDAPMDGAASLENGVLGQVTDLLEIELKSSPQSLLHSSRVADAYGDYLQGRGYLYRFDKPGNCDKAISAFQRALAKDSQYTFAYAGLGEAYLAKYNLTGDKQWLEEAVLHSQEAIGLNDKIAAPRVTLGAIYRILGRYDQAIQEFKTAASLDPLNADAYRELAIAYDNSNNLSQAEKTYRRAIDLRPNSWLSYKDLGVFYVNHNRYRDAEPEYRKVNELTPDNDWGYRNLGTLYQLEGRYTEAEAMLKKALSLQKSVPAYTNLATLYYFERRYADSVKMNELAIQLPEGKNSSVLWGNLADAYRWTPGLEQKAPDAYRQAIHLAEAELALNPKSAPANIGLAVYWAKLGDQKKALAYLAEARRLSPNQMHVLFQSVLIYELTGKRKLALEALREALRAGYSRDDARREPELAKLREDPQFQRLINSQP